jgi:hypothetical protein
MKISRIIIIVVVVIIVVLVALFAFTALVASTTSTNSVWQSGSEYPLQVSGDYGVGGQQCVNSTAYIYCIGGEDVNAGPRDQVYSSNPLSASSPNISSWTSDSSSYPDDIHGQSCFIYSTNVYCVGGTYDDAGDDVATSYYASLNNGQVGTWSNTTSYPNPADTLSCTPSSGYVYCVGGTSEPDGTNASAVSVSSVWYAPLSSTGIGNWSTTTSYPSGAYYPDCYASLGFIYCIGGADTNDNAVSSVYYASLTSSGVGVWTGTTAYPSALSGQSCVIVSSIIYCVGGEGNSGDYSSAVYYATVSSSGVGAWKQATGYSDSTSTICAYSSGYLYCAGGFDGSSSAETPEVNYASLSSLTNGTA